MLYLYACCWIYSLELRKEVKVEPGEITSQRSFAAVMILYLIQAIVFIQGVQNLFHPLVLRTIIEGGGLGPEHEKMLRSVKRGLDDGHIVVKALRTFLMLERKKGQREMMIFG